MTNIEQAEKVLTRIGPGELLAYSAKSQAYSLLSIAKSLEFLCDVVRVLEKPPTLVTKPIPPSPT